MKPSDDPKADQLVNSNISQPEAGMEEGSDPNGETGMGDLSVADIT